MRGLSDRIVVKEVDPPKHLSVQRWVRSGIFEALSTFRVLEKRLTDLTTNEERGHAFEVFAEAYLATVAVEKAKHVWPGTTVPRPLRKRLFLSSGDKGVDGVL